MNYAGPFEFSLSSDNTQTDASVGAETVSTGNSHGASPTVVVQDANLLFNGDFKRAGLDLVLSKDGHDHVVSDYFKGSLRAGLSSPDGATLSPDLIKALVGEVQLAQLGGGANAAAQVIGSVTKLTGSATVIRNGVSVMLNVGDQVQKGDVVQAGADSSLGLTFIDGTVFGLSSNARMVLNEMVYDPNGSSNSSLLSLVQGTITFVAGETAKHGDMRVDTPVATMGIRGTAVLVEIGFEVPGQGGAPPVKFQVLVEPGGHVGSYQLYNKTTGQVIGTVNQAGQVTSVFGSGDTSTGAADPLSSLAQGIIQQTLQQYFPNYVPNANPRSGGTGSGSAPADPNSGTSPDPLKFSPSPDPGIGQPYTVPINLPGDTLNTTPINVTITRFNTAPTITVTPVIVTLPIDKTNFEIRDQVQITDPDSGDVAIPYVPGTAHIISASGPANTPSSLDLKALVSINPTTGAVSYDPALFKFLGAGQKAVYTIGFDSQSGPDTIHETLTFTVDGTNDAPVVAAPLTSATTQGHVLQAIDLLAGASDPDAGETATLSVTNVKYAVDNSQATSTAPHGVTLTGTTLHVDGTDASFTHLAQGQATTIVVTYDITDAQGAITAQTETITVTGTNDAPVVGAALADSVTQGDAAIDVNLLAGASDADDGETAHLSVTNIHYTVDLGSASTTPPAGITLVGTTLHVDASNPAFAYLGENQTSTITVTYDVTDAHGTTAAQTETITITGINDAPEVTGTSINVVPGGTVLLDDNSFTVVDPDSTSFFFTISDVTGGTFQTWNGEAWVPAIDTDSGLFRTTEVPTDGQTVTFTSADLHDGNVRFVSNGGESQPTFTVQVNDGAKHNSDSEPFDGKVGTADNHAPVVSCDVTLACVNEDGSLTITEAQLLAHASDIDGQTLHVTCLQVSDGSGTLTNNEDGTWTFTPAPDFNGPVSFTYHVDDGITSVATGASLKVTPVNDAPSGAVTISGTLQEGATLSATNTLTDADGLGTLHYQWQRTGPNGTVAISEATGASYILTAADVGLKITVIISYIDGDGTAEAVASPQTDAITAALPPYGASNYWTGAAGDHNWTTAGNWSLGIVPTADEIVYINTSAPPAITFHLNGLLNVAELHVGTVAELDLTGNGTLNVGILVNDGDIQLSPGSTLEVNGVVQNSGTVLVDDHTAGATLLIHGTVTLEGDGVVTLDGSADRITGDSLHSKLINADNTINGYGKLGDGKLSIVNECDGQIIASDRSHALIIDTGKGSLINFGLIASMANGGLKIDGDLVNYGTIEAHAGLFQIEGNLTGHGTAKIDGGTLEFGGWSDANVTFSSPSGDELVLDRGSHFTGTVSGLSYGDSIDLEGVAPWQFWLSQHNGVVDVHYGYGANDYFTLTDPGVLNHLDISSDHHGGIEISWTNAAPELDTSDVHLTKTGNTFKISGLSASDSDWTRGDNYTLAVTGHANDTDTLSSINRDLDSGFTFTKGDHAPAQATVAVQITDQYGASDQVNFIFNTTNVSGNSQVFLTGDAGKDVIFATNAQDVLKGNGGADQFVFAARSGGVTNHDTILDFNPGQDKIELDNYKSVPGLSGPFSELQLYLWERSGGIEQSGRDTLIHLDNHDTLRLTGVNMSQLHASDFIVHPYSQTA